MLSPPSSTSALTPKRRLSVDSEAESLEEVQEISTPSVSPSDSTVSKETEIFFQGQVQKGKTGRKKKDSPPISYHSCNSAEGETDDTYQEQKKRIGMEWNGRSPRKTITSYETWWSRHSPWEGVKFSPRTCGCGRLWRFSKHFPSMGNEVWIEIQW